MSTATQSPTTPITSRLSKAHVELVPGSLQAMFDLHGAVARVGVRKVVLDLVALRASQINGCSFCVHMHAADLRKAGESDERVDTVAAWRESPWFTDEERAALALAEAVTRVADHPDPVSDELWDEVADHFSEPEVAALVVAIAATNVWNRLNAATRQPAGSLPL
ncbi:MAG TPA: carboxymuconolactone decarboxylase family protein [Acidimicrobiales bacterium]|nr:carboxymuconolactone decarboxylase family protein [Acidimicrobiales bacterium]